MIDVALVFELKKQLEMPDDEIIDISCPVQLFDLGIKKSYPIITLALVEEWITLTDMMSYVVIVPGL